MTLAEICVRRGVFAVMLIAFLGGLGADHGVAGGVAGGRSRAEATENADEGIKRVLETVDGGGEVSLTGARLRQVRIFADADKLAAYGLTIIDVQQAIQKENVEV